MQFTYESQGTSTFLSYQLTASDNVDSMTMGMVNNNTIEGVIPFSYSQLDSIRYLKYNVSSKISLAQYFSGIVNRRRLIGVMKSIATAVLNAEDYMIEPSSFVWDREYIFVDVSTAEAQMICLPIMRENTIVDLEMFFKSIILGVQFDQTENCDYVARLLGFFNANTMFSLQDFLKMLKELERGAGNGMSTVAPASVTVPVQEPTVTPSSIPITSTSQPSPVPAPNQVFNTNQPIMSVQPSMQEMQVTSGQSSMSGMFSMPSEHSVSGQPTMPEQIVMPGMSHGQTESQKPAKKKFSLFGGKKEKEPKQPKPEKKAKKEAKKRATIPGRSNGQIPGQNNASGAMNMPGGMKVPDNMNIPNNVNVSAGGKSNNVISMPTDNGMPQGGSQGIGTAYQPTTYGTEKGSFGGTVVLNASNKSQGTVVLNAQNAPQNVKPIPYIVRVKNGQKIPLDKGVLKIGSDASYADYAVMDNRAISRSHADIRVKGESIYIADNNSTNHTFVNGTMLTPNVEIPLKDGSTFRLADEEFEIHYK